MTKFQNEIKSLNFSRERVKVLAKGYEIISIEKFEEGELPRKLFIVTFRKEEYANQSGYQSSR